MNDLMEMFEDIAEHDDAGSRDKAILRAPFSYPGGKSRSVEQIIKRLPRMKVYVEPFGGSAAVLLARRPANLEVYNDRYGGVTAFYQCIRDQILLAKLCDRIELTVHSREEFVICHDTWKDTQDIVERAAKWYYMTVYSFGSLGRNFGRATSHTATMMAIRERLFSFPLIHDRFRKVQVENQDWRDCMKDYDSHDTCFYLDPPYVDASPGIYEHEMSHEDHRRFIDFVFSCKGFCAISGYSNPVYDNNPWDMKHEWESFVSMKSAAYTETNNKKHLEGVESRGHAMECLWIKEAK